MAKNYCHTTSSFVPDRQEIIRCTEAVTFDGTTVSGEVEDITGELQEASACHF